MTANFWGTRVVSCIFGVVTDIEWILKLLSHWRRNFRKLVYHDSWAFMIHGFTVFWIFGLCWIHALSVWTSHPPFHASMNLWLDTAWAYIHFVSKDSIIRGVWVFFLFDKRVTTKHSSLYFSCFCPLLIKFDQTCWLCKVFWGSQRANFQQQGNLVNVQLNQTVLVHRNDWGWHVIKLTCIIVFSLSLTPKIILLSVMFRRPTADSYYTLLKASHIMLGVVWNVHNQELLPT